MLPVFTLESSRPLPLWLVSEKRVAAWAREQPPAVQTWIRIADFKGEDGRSLLLPDADGGLLGAVLGLGADRGTPPFAVAALPPLLPAGDYVLREAGSAGRESLALGWALGAYRFDRYRKSSTGKPPARLVVDDRRLAEETSRIAEAVAYVRDLVNTPANDMGPRDLADAARSIAQTHGAALRVVGGDELARDFPLVHAVGQAAARPPLLIDLVAGETGAPKVTLVGKGVCFDTGGLDLKSRPFMELMKKDMGGAANVLGLARLILSARLPVRLRVIVPAVENAVGGSAYRPGDVIKSRKGTTIEIGDTDAEGRLVLADALALAAEEAPDLLVDMATLTGAARAALGPEIAPFYSDDEGLANELLAASQRVADPLWRLPLWAGYESWLQSKIADVNNVADTAMAGSIIGALFLKPFALGAKHWLHTDIYAWNAKARPGQPVGGEAQGMRALYDMLKKTYADNSSTL